MLQVSAKGLYETICFRQVTINSGDVGGASLADELVDVGAKHAQAVPIRRGSLRSRTGAQRD